MIGHSFPTIEENPYIPTMHKNRIIPTLGVAVLVPLCAWAQAVPGGSVTAKPPAGTTPETKAAEKSAVRQNVPGGLNAGPAPEAKAAEKPATDADRVIDAAVKKIAALKSVSADILQKVETLGQKFQVNGRFLKAPQRRVYLRLTVNGLADSAGTTLQVCDGKTLWDFQLVLTMPMYHKYDVVKVFEKLDSPELDAGFREEVLNRMGFAGPDILLTGLRKAVLFDQREEGTLDGVPVWVLHGTWKDRKGLLGPNQQPLADTAPLPAYVPSVVTVWIGKEDGWPYKVLLVGKPPTILEDNRPRDPYGQPIGSKTSAPKVQPSRVELIYSNVKFNPNLKGAEFAFSPPPGSNVDDGTEGMLTLLDQKIRQATAKAASGPESANPEQLLQKPLELPKAGAAIQ
jgi:outer membrane lipoprotein-sorting protein